MICVKVRMSLSVQACRGREEVEAFMPGQSGASLDKRNDTSDQHSDVLIASSTIADFVAFRSTVDGSFFIRHLCQVLQDHAHEDTLQDMLLTVFDKVKLLTFMSELREWCRCPTTGDLSTPALPSTTRL